MSYAKMWEEVKNFNPREAQQKSTPSAGENAFLDWIETQQNEYYGPGGIYEPGQHGRNGHLTAERRPNVGTRTSGGNGGMGFLNGPALATRQGGNFLQGGTGPGVSMNMGQWRNQLGIAQAEQAQVPMTHNRNT